MSEFYKFAGEHPLLVILLAFILVGFAVRIIPWSKRDDD